MHAQPFCDKFERRLLPPASIKLGQDIIVPRKVGHQARKHDMDDMHLVGPFAPASIL